MKAFKMTWVLLALFASLNVQAASVGQNDGQVECTESVQSARFEGGDVEVQDYTSETSEDETESNDR